MRLSGSEECILNISEEIYSQHSIGFDATCKDTVLPVAWLMWTLKTIRTRVFLRPMSVSPFRSSMSELRSFKIPAQSILLVETQHEQCESESTRQMIIVNETVIYWELYSGVHQHSPKWGCSHVSED